jgi:drug/metabolite transporter (DMT)-like permease
MSQTSLAKQRHRRAILLMFCALAILICLDASGKFLGGRGVPVEASTWSRYLGHLIVATVLFLPRGGWHVFKPLRPGVQWGRGVLMLLVTLFYFGALKYLPLAEATALFFMTPILTTILAAWFLHEHPTRITILAIALGFAGVLVVVRPGVELAGIGIGLVIAAAVCNAGYQTLTRGASKSRLGTTVLSTEGTTLSANPALVATASTEAVPPIRGERTGTQLIYSGLVGAVIMTATLPFWWSGEWLRSADLTTRLVFLALGALGAFGHLLLIRAYTLAPAPVLTPWMYLQLALSVLLGWLIFGAIPDWLTLVGMLVIALAPQLTRFDQRRFNL